MFIFEVPKFYLTKYQIFSQLIFSVIVCICKIHVFNGGNSMSNHTKRLDHATLITWVFFEIFTSDRYYRGMKALEILAPNSKHFRIHGIS